MQRFSFLLFASNFFHFFMEWNPICSSLIKNFFLSTFIMQMRPEIMPHPFSKELTWTSKVLVYMFVESIILEVVIKMNLGQRFAEESRTYYGKLEFISELRQDFFSQGKRHMIRMIQLILTSHQNKKQTWRKNLKCEIIILHWEKLITLNFNTQQINWRTIKFYIKN